MKNLKVTVLIISIACLSFSCMESAKKTGEANGDEKEIANENVLIQSPEDAIKELKNGNKRFLQNSFINTDYKKQIEQTQMGQKPHSVILACMDSRVPPEIIFDQGIGNIFVVRVAGNIENEDVLGSFEYAVEHANSKLIVVMGHSHCGAVTGAVEDFKLGNLTQLLDQIKPAIKSDSNDPGIIEETAKNNVKITIADILNRSVTINDLVKDKKISIVGAFYDIETGEVHFME